METMSQFRNEKELWKIRCLRIASALVDFMNGVQDNDIHRITGLPEADCERIAEAREDALVLVKNE